MLPLQIHTYSRFYCALFFALWDTSKEFQVDQGELHTEQKTTGQRHDPPSSHLFHSTEPHPSKTLAYKQLFCLDEAQCFEDNSEAELMSNEEVESVLTVIPKEAKETYNHLSITVKTLPEAQRTHGLTP